MIEPLECRKLFTSAAYSELLVLRSDLASVGHSVHDLIVANAAAIANLQSDMSIFPTRLTSDNANLRELRFQFVSSVSQLANDDNDIRLLLGQNITRLINVSNADIRTPTVTIGSAVISAGQQLTAQADAAAAVLTDDAGQLQTNYENVLAFIAASHPTDIPLQARVSHIATVFSTATTAIQDAAETVDDTDVPNFITAEEPNDAAA